MTAMKPPWDTRKPTTSVTRAVATRTLTACLLSVVIAAPHAAAQEVTSHREHGYTIVAGTMDTAGWGTRARETITDFASYSSWALRYMDGKDPESAEDWVHFTDFTHPNPQTMILHYDMNRPWPLNATGNTAEFDLQFHDAGTRVALQVRNAPFGMSDARMTLDTSDLTAITFRLEIKFWWLVDVILDNAAFQLFLEDRVAKMQRNLWEYVHSPAPVHR